MESSELHRVRGTHDVLPPERSSQQVVQSEICRVFDLYGYQPIDTPVLETTDLFLRKSGEEIAARMYSFTHWNRSLCLRPEFTASVIRAYVNHLQDRPLPVRLQYAGPTFRYEKPQRGRHRQFTEVGVECVGAGGAGADAEILAIARHGLDVVGLPNARFVVGHLGVVLEFLEQLGMEARAQSLILGVMEHLSRSPGDEARIVTRLAAMLGAGDEADQADRHPLADLIQAFGTEDAARIAGSLLEQANLSLEGGSRPPSEIVERLLHKAHRVDPTPGLQKAIELIGRLRDVAGPPSTALPALRRVLTDYGLREAPVIEVEQALEFFNAYFDSPATVHVDLSLARGLRYYTGLVFEVYDESDVQIAGGGRYDDLTRALGSRVGQPACGFSYGLERVIEALTRRSPLSCADPNIVLVAPFGAEDYTTAAHLAGDLRREGLAAELDLRFRGPKASLRHADRRDIPLVFLIGEAERQDGSVVLRDMRNFGEQRVPLRDAPAAARALLARASPDSNTREQVR